MANTTNATPLVRKFTDKDMAGFSRVARTRFEPSNTEDTRLRSMAQTIVVMQKYVPAIDLMLAEIERIDEPRDMYRDIARGFFVSFRNAVSHYHNAEKLFEQQKEMPNEDATTRDGYTIGDLADMIGIRAEYMMQRFHELTQLLADTQQFVADRK